MAKSSSGNSSVNPEYATGSCNIGPSEIRKRKIVAVVGLILFFISLSQFSANHVSAGARVSIFFPSLMFAIGFVQSRRKFCLAYGFMGSFNMGSAKQIARVQSAEDRAIDRKVAISILGQAAFVAVIMTIAVVALPL